MILCRNAIVISAAFAFASACSAGQIGAAKPVGVKATIKTLEVFPNGGTITSSQPLDLTKVYSPNEIAALTTGGASTAATGYGNQPPMPNPPSDVPATVKSVTEVVDNGQYTRTTTWNRTVANDPSAPEGVDDGPWTLGGDNTTQDSGGGGCNSKQTGNDCHDPN